MIDLVGERLPELWLRTGEHLILTGLSTGFAIVVGVPLGVLAARVNWLRNPLLGAVGILQTVPSLAMLAFLLALLQRIGALPAIIALTLYALLPIVRNTLTGLEGIRPEIQEAALGIGMDRRQQLLIVQVPLAAPVILAGIRTAAVIGVGIATLAAFIGAGGLGQFIVRGLALSNTRLILLGAIPAALLALLVDYSIGAAEWGLKRTRRSERGSVKAKLKPLGLATPVLLVLLGVVAYLTAPSAASATHAGQARGGETVRIASKNFTEQFILAEMMGQLIEARTDLAVDRRFGLGGTMIAHGALSRGEVDLYAEYTGTALTAILGRNVVTDPDGALGIVREAYRARFAAEWLQPFGFNNTYALAVRATDAEEFGWEKIADLASRALRLRAGFPSEFMERPDGYPRLRRVYGFSFGTVIDMDPAIMYEAVAKGELDVISAFATDGRIEAYDLALLTDDREAFPPYYAAPVVRIQALQAYPELRGALAPLDGLIDDATMRRLNFRVDERGESPADVARGFLRSQQLLK